MQCTKSWQCTYRLPFTWQCKVYCMYSIYCSYTVLLAVDLQYILRPTASILHFGLGTETIRCWSLRGKSESVFVFMYHVHTRFLSPLYSRLFCSVHHCVDTIVQEHIQVCTINWLSVLRYNVNPKKIQTLRIIQMGFLRYRVWSKCGVQFVFALIQLCTRRNVTVDGTFNFQWPKCHLCLISS